MKRLEGTTRRQGRLVRHMFSIGLVLALPGLAEAIVSTAPQTVTVQLQTPGSTVQLFGLWRHQDDPQDFVSVGRIHEQLTDTDNDGIVTWNLPTGGPAEIPYLSVWVAVEFYRDTAGVMRYAVSESVPPIPPGRGAPAGTVVSRDIAGSITVDDRSECDVVIFRPNQAVPGSIGSTANPGFWFAEQNDFMDGISDRSITVGSATFQALPGSAVLSGLAPAQMEVVVSIDPFYMEYSILVYEVANLPPTANPQSLTIDDQPTTITLTGFDPESAALSYTIISGLGAGSLGAITASNGASADVVYSPPIGGDPTVYTDSFDIQVEDGFGGVATATISIDLTRPDLPPPVTALPDSLTALAGGSVTVTDGGATSLFANDMDARLRPLYFSAFTQQPSYGVAGIQSDGSFVYAPAPSSGSASDSFAYEVCAGTAPADCDTATVSVSIIASKRITLTVSGAGSGTVLSDPPGLSCPGTCTSLFAENQRVRLLPVAASGSVLGAFGGDEDCDDGLLAMAVDRTCTATFDPVSPPQGGTVTVEVSTSGTGTGTIRTDPAGIDCGATCSYDFVAFERLDLVAIPDAGSRFVNWNGSGDCLDGVLGLDAGANCVAVFDSASSGPTETLTVVVNGSGSVVSQPLGLVCVGGETCGANFAFGSTVYLYARPGQSTFLGWSGGGTCVGSNPKLAVPLNSAVTCTADFAP